MSVSVRAFRKVASGLRRPAGLGQMAFPAICEFLEAAADGDEATAPLSPIVKTPLAIAVGGGISVELAISASVWAHVSDLLLN